ncbi:acetolactate decarboxylase [Microbacterium sp. bgisy207]|uniref:acetolactate decarboxylase n=1 Tax=Microbacterium sp. bgisy207 TaxID=3413800 RepID=UPI003EC00E20
MTTPRHTIHQTSVIAALVDGVYDGETTVGTLRRRGDFGIGTFAGLDGELVLVDGTCYRLRDDGSASVAGDDESVPYAVVTRFTPHHSFTIDGTHTRAEVTAMIDATLGSSNYMYAVRVEGVYERMTVRAVHVQQHPYRPLVEATAEQAVTTFSGVRGTVVGFRTPAFEEGLSVPGYHAHFLLSDRTGGGHVLDHVMTHGEVHVCVGTDLHLELPRSDEFARAHLDPDDLREQVDRAES